MNYLKILGIAAMAATSLTAFVGAATASATTLEVGGVPQNSSVSIVASIKSGTSIIMRDTAGFSLKTCLSSTMSWSTSSPFTGASVTGAASTLSHGNCTHPVTVHKAGTLHISNISGTTNGTLTSSGMEVTTYSTAFGSYLNCKTGAGTHLGTLIGTASLWSHATIHVNSTILCSGISSKLEGTYIVTSPTGLGVVA
jgi:hypothetical protein